MKSRILSLPPSAARIRMQASLFVGRVSDDLVLLSAAQASFFLTTSAVPFLSLFMALTAFLLPGGLSRSPLPAFFPDGSGELLRLLSFHAAAALWTASRGVYALRSGLQRIYGGPAGKNALLRRLSALPATFGVLAVLAGSVLTLFFGGSVGRIRDLSGPWLPFVAPASVLTLTFILLYAGAGRRSAAFRARSGKLLAPHLPGALFASSGWMLFSLLFSYYIGRFPRASAVYGSLGAICLLMLWLYFCTIIFLLGAEINLLLAEKRTGKNG